MRGRLQKSWDLKLNETILSGECTSWPGSQWTFAIKENSMGIYTQYTKKRG